MVLRRLRIPDEDDDFEANYDRMQKEEEDAERLRRILACVPCDDGVEQNQTRKDAKGVKRKRGQHECDVCEKVFGYPSDLVKRVRTHTKEKPYECDVCEKRFTQSGSLKIHTRVHTNEKPYECDVCEKRFRESGTLKEHLRTRANEKPYECHVCEKRYRQANGLKYHMRTQHQ